MTFSQARHPTKTREINGTETPHTIFPDKAMTVAAIDRLVHHATILEMNAESFRQRAATSAKAALNKTPATTTSDSQTEGEN